jgi:uncharacterized OsmC-like protein
MLKVNVKTARARVTTRFWAEGSVRAETVQTRCTGVDTRLEIESDDDPALVAKLARVSEQGCYVINTIRAPTPTTYAVSLNGQPLDLSTPEA